MHKIHQFFHKSNIYKLCKVCMYQNLWSIWSKKGKKNPILWRLPLLSSRLNARSVNWFESFFETWILLFRFAGCSCQLLYHVVALISIPYSPYCWIQCIAANFSSLHSSKFFAQMDVQSQSKIYVLIISCSKMSV